MTRDEARFALQGPLGEHFGHKVPEGVDDAWLDCWVALGMLTLDEPQSGWETFKEIMVGEFGYLADERCERTTLNEIKTALERAGLQIVEK